MHLKPIVREGLIEVWEDTKLEPGDEWREGIEKAMEDVAVGILLVSADFLASDFIVQEEVPRLLDKAAQEGATILPIIVSPCRFEKTALARYQAVNAPSKPLAAMRRIQQEDTLRRLAEAVEEQVARSRLAALE